ncbi:MAG TPA: radical SAM protein, partial [Thermoanaerobaculia bacterium]|nr:radical SAM protein [Thermoanaerobaculia bacterium]
MSDAPATPPRGPLHGRGAPSNPANRFERLHVVVDDEVEESAWEDHRRVETRYLKDTSRSVISTNTSPDVGFDASL